MSSKQVSAKVRLERTQEGDDQTVLYFVPDYNDNRNKEWAKYTPALSLTMTVKNEVAAQFKVGAPVTLLFQLEDDAPAPSDG